MSTVIAFLSLAIVGGTVHGEGEPIEGATVVIEGDRIIAVGVDVPIPDGATKIDARAQVVTAGLVDAYTQLGLVEVWGVAGSRDNRVEGDPIRAAQRAVDSFNPHSAVIPTQVAHGVTSVVAVPDGGWVSGQAAWFDLDGSTGSPNPSSAVVFFLSPSGSSTRGSKLVKLREALDDARRYKANREAWERNQYRSFGVSRLDLEALVPVIDGKTPLLVNTDRRADIEAALRLAQEERIRIILAGAAEAWQVAAEIAAAEVPVILDPSANSPDTLDQIAARGDAAAILHRAGVEVIISTFGEVHNVRKLRQWAGNAVREGLPHAAALRAVTAAPAAALGGTERGVLAAGYVANLVIWSGDPFELSTRANAVIIAGKPVSTDHRQKALADRYRNIPPGGVRKAPQLWMQR